MCPMKVAFPTTFGAPRGASGYPLCLSAFPHALTSQLWLPENSFLSVPRSHLCPLLSPPRLGTYWTSTAPGRVGNHPQIAAVNQKKWKKVHQVTRGKQEWRWHCSCASLVDCLFILYEYVYTMCIYYLGILCMVSRAILTSIIQAP